MKASAVTLLVLVALAFVATSEAQKWCRVSSYKVPVLTAIKNKNTMYDACIKSKSIKERPTIVKSVQMVNGCAVITQQVSSAEAWDAYSACEKSDANKASYMPLKTYAAACENYTAKGPCK